MSGADVPPPEEIILYEKDPSTRIATITLNRPDQLNSPTIGARKRYADLLFKASIDDDVKVLVIRGVGDDLGSGADLDELMAKREDGTALEEEFGLGEDDDVTWPGARSYRSGASLLHWYGNARSGCRSLQEFKKISILEVKGYCYGWHFYQAGDADLVVSSDDALFGHPAFRYVGLRTTDVAVGDVDGDAQVPGDGLHRPSLHRPADVRVQFREQRGSQR